MNIVTKDGLEHLWADIKSKFASSLSVSGKTLTLKDKNGNTLSTVTTQDTVTTATTSGSGNAVTSITASNGALTVTKGETFYSKTETQNYIASRGENLVTNGTALLGNNYNFSAFTYNGSDTYYAGGSFKYTTSGGMPILDEYIPVDVTDSYMLSYYIKSDNSSVRFYDVINSYDIDKNTIMAYNVMWIAGSTTTLAKELKNGDTKVYLTSVAGFNKTTTYTYQKGLIFWNYANSFGYTYPTETYSRNRYQNLWAGSNSFNTTENSITLSSAWSGGAYPAGTSVSQCSDGGNYIYLNSNYTVTSEWQKKVGVLSGVGKNNASGKFREGTAFVKIAWLMNRFTSANTLISTVLFTKNRAISSTNNGYADNATKATQDASGNVITTTYATKASLATVATSGSYSDLSNKPTIPTVPTNVSSFTNDSGYITSSAISNKADKSTTLSGYGITNAYTKTEVDQKIASGSGVTWDIIYPVGAIYISTVNTSPRTLFGGGTWERFNNDNTTLVFAKSTSSFWGTASEYFWNNGTNVVLYAWRRTA